MSPILVKLVADSVHITKMANGVVEIPVPPTGSLGLADLLIDFETAGMRKPNRGKVVNHLKENNFHFEGVENGGDALYTNAPHD